MSVMLRFKTSALHWDIASQIVHLIYPIMQKLNFSSSAIDSLSVDETNGLALVEFKNGREYTYRDVDKKAIRDLLFNSAPGRSIGKWVNQFCVNGLDTSFVYGDETALYA